MKRKIILQFIVIVFISSCSPFSTYDSDRWPDRIAYEYARFIGQWYNYSTETFLTVYEGGTCDWESPYYSSYCYDDGFSTDGMKLTFTDGGNRVGDYVPEELYAGYTYKFTNSYMFILYGEEDLVFTKID